jgi:hypothetical protein
MIDEEPSEAGEPDSPALRRIDEVLKSLPLLHNDVYAGMGVDAPVLRSGCCTGLPVGPARSFFDKSRRD